MKKEKRNRFEKNDPAALLGLVVALICFGFDLFHFSHHLGHDSTLLDLPGVRLKLAWKITLVLIPFGLSVFSYRLTLLGLVVVILLSKVSPVFAGIFSSDCERTRELMKESGIARDAHEDFLGRLKIKSPRSTFPPEMDQITWWGTFKPFEFWGNPELKSTWINPQGLVVSQQPFRGGQCELAKTALSANTLPRGRFEPGMWRVVVTCQDSVVDNHPFAVVGSPGASGDGKTNEDSGIMIWADHVK